MRALILLTALQALSAYAAPHHRKRDVCAPSSAVTSIHSSSGQAASLTSVPAPSPSATNIQSSSGQAASLTSVPAPSSTSTNIQSSSAPVVGLTPVPSPSSTPVGQNPGATTSTSQASIIQGQTSANAATGEQISSDTSEGGNGISTVIWTSVSRSTEFVTTGQTVSNNLVIETVVAAVDESGTVKEVTETETESSPEATDSAGPLDGAPSGGGGNFYQSPSTTAVVASVSVLITDVLSGTAQILPAPATDPATSGTIITSLGLSAANTASPIIVTSIPQPNTTISVPTSSVTIGGNSNIAMATPSSDIFVPIATDAPPSVITTRSDHPVPRLGIQPQQGPLSTNKFYANFFLSTQTAPTFTHPYSLSWAAGGGPSSSWGMTISHIDADQRVFGPDPSANPAEYFINPNGIQSLVVSAVELGNSTAVTTDTQTAFSINVNLLPSTGSQPAITFPLVQGMGFVTAKYAGGTPLIQTGVFFRSITKSSTSPKAGVTKYTIILEDGKTWLLYAYSTDGSSLDFTVVNNGLAQATSNFNGFIQIAKNPGNAESLYDTGCGVYPIGVALSGSVSGTTGSYTLAFEKGGLTNETLTMFALPHHVQSFSSTTNSSLTAVQLQTTTKGVATAIVADSWTLVENLPTTLDFAPWSPSGGSRSTLSTSAIAAISSVALSEVSQNMSAQTNLNSMYYSGKVCATL
jgi:endo-1,3(4)-beta-glucanase